MTNISHGMSIAEIQELGNRLQGRYAADLRGYVRDIDRLIQEAGPLWVGNDADRFRSWWPAKRAKMLAIVDDLHGYGQAALNDVAEQSNASEVKGGTGPIAPGLVAPGNEPGTAPGGQTAPATSGALPGTDRTWQQVEQAYRENYRKYGLWADGADGGENEYQCVSWAWFRMRELGYNGPQTQGHGGQVAGNLGGTTSTLPTAGAVMSYYYGSTDKFGHVVIAEQVWTDDQGRMHVRVSEMNTGTDSAGNRAPDAYDGEPNEYKASRELVRNADGSWTDGGVRRTITVANPTYGAPRI